MVQTDGGFIELWWSHDEHGALELTAIDNEDDGQKAILGSTTFGPFDTRVDMVRWLERVLPLDVQRRL